MLCELHVYHARERERERNFPITAHTGRFSASFFPFDDCMFHALSWLCQSLLLSNSVRVESCWCVLSADERNCIKLAHETNLGPEESLSKSCFFPLLSQNVSHTTKKIFKTFYRNELFPASWDTPSFRPGPDVRYFFAEKPEKAGHEWMVHG